MRYSRKSLFFLFFFLFFGFGPLVVIFPLALFFNMYSKIYRAGAVFLKEGLINGEFNSK